MKKFKWMAAKFIMKASQAEKNLAAKQAAFYDVMTADYKTKFADQKAIQDSLTAAFGPIIAAGPGQFGLTREEEAATRTSARDATSVAYQNAARSVRGTLAARGGGDTLLPSGAEAQIEAGIAVQAAQSESEKQLDITKFGYDIGRQKFFNAANILGGNAAQMNPIGYSGSAIGAGSSAFSSAYQINQENTAWKGQLAGAIAGGATAILGGMAGGSMGGGGTLSAPTSLPTTTSNPFAQPGGGFTQPPR